MKHSVIASEQRERGNPCHRRVMWHGWIAASRAALLAMTLLPFPAYATKLIVCDGKAYDVTITNGGETHMMHMTPTSGPIEEFGPQVSMQVEGHPRVTITEPYDEYCIRGGKISLQQIRSGSDTLSGGGGSR